jgi:hypothetical protein
MVTMAARNGNPSLMVLSLERPRDLCAKMSVAIVNLAFLLKPSARVLAKC